MTFPIPRPRGADMPAKLPRKQTPGLAITVKKALEKPRMHQITLENREVGRASTERRRAIAKGGI
jgi:hypothetical protein